MLSGKEEVLRPRAADKEEKGKVVMGEQLEETQKKQVEVLEREFQGVFSKNPGTTDLVEHQIQVKPGAVVKLIPRRWPRNLGQALKKEVLEMECMGVTEPSKSLWRSYPVMVPKSEGQISLFRL